MKANDLEMVYLPTEADERAADRNIHAGLAVAAVGLVMVFAFPPTTAPATRANRPLASTGENYSTASITFQEVSQD